MDYRTAAEEPLIVIGSAGIQAFDPRDGALKWRHAWESPGFNRVASFDAFVAVANAQTLRIFERATGRPCGEHRLAFTIQRLLAQGSRLFALGTDGLACLDGNTLAWAIDKQKGLSWLSDGDFVRRVGGVVEKVPFFAGKGGNSDLALVWGEIVTQTDRDS